MNNEAYSTWLEIDLGAVQHNIRELMRITKKPLMAVVKANGYGHGLAHIGQAAQNIGVQWCGVARVEEALKLRQSGFDGKILVLGYTPPLRVIEAANDNISLTIYDMEVAKTYSSLAQAAQIELNVHIKFDTGMGRLGITPENGFNFVRWAHNHKHLNLEGVFTHFARADEPELDTTDKQIERFEELMQKITAANMRPRWIHACNSAGTLYYPQAHYDLVRPGIAIYGLEPSEEAPLPPGFRPALTWKSRLISIKNLPAGHGIGYNHRYLTKGIERIGVLATGYADGYRRVMGNSVLIHGQKVPVVGGVCMDQCMLQLDTVPDAAIGDEVVLIGSQGNQTITAEEAASKWHTVNYELVCGLADRLPRIYNGNGNHILTTI